MRRIVLLLTLIGLFVGNIKAQQFDGLLCLNSNLPTKTKAIHVTSPENTQARNQGFYRHIDLESGNIFSTAAFSVVGGLLNMTVSDKLCRNAFLVTPVTAKPDLDVENYKWNYIDALDLFKDIQVGGGMGYQSQRGAFNVGVFATFHYKVNQFKVEDKTQNAFLKHGIHRIIPGINAVFTFGDLTSSGVRTYVEAGLRYAIAVHYSNPYNLETKDLNNGLISHFAIYIAPHWDFALQDIGVYVNINHYNLLKDEKMSSLALSELRMWTIGIQFSISRDQAAIRAGL